MQPTPSRTLSKITVARKRVAAVSVHGCLSINGGTPPAGVCRHDAAGSTSWLPQDVAAIGNPAFFFVDGRVRMTARRRPQDVEAARAAKQTYSYGKIVQREYSALGDRGAQTSPDSSVTLRGGQSPNWKISAQEPPRFSIRLTFEHAAQILPRLDKIYPHCHMNRPSTTGSATRMNRYAMPPSPKLGPSPKCVRPSQLSGSTEIHPTSTAGGRRKLCPLSSCPMNRHLSE